MMRLGERQRHEGLQRLHENGARRIVLYGTDEAAELAYLTLKEAGIDRAAVFGADPGGRFIGLPVRAVSELGADECDAVIVATFDRPESAVAELVRLGVAVHKIVTLRPIERGRDGGPAA
jgi:hypothetical protein